MDNLWINGEFQSLEGATLPLEDRATLFGDGIYEVIAAYQGVPILLKEHLDRWERSAEGLRIKLHYSRQEREDVIAQLIRNLPSDRAMIYGQLSRGVARRAHLFPSDPEPTEFWFVRELPPKKPEIYEKGVAAMTHPDERWARCWIKSTSLLANVLAKQAAKDAGAFEAILYREDQTVTEASVANFLAVKDGVIHTPPANGRILSGCKRGMVLRLAREHGIEVREEPFKLSMLPEIDEALLTSTTINAFPVTTIDHKPVGNGEVGPVSRKIRELVEEEIDRTVKQSVGA